jgi:hypothetical protein
VCIQLFTQLLEIVDIQLLQSVFELGLAQSEMLFDPTSKLGKVLLKCHLIDSVGVPREEILRAYSPMLEMDSADLEMIFLAHPETSATRAFYEEVLRGSSSSARFNLRALFTKILASKTGKASKVQKPRAQSTELSLAEQTLTYFLANPATFPGLRDDAWLKKPQLLGSNQLRLSWGLSRDLASKSMLPTDPVEQAKRAAYSLLAQGLEAEAQKAIAQLAPASLPALKAWMKRADTLPSLIPACFVGHVGLRKLRITLQATRPDLTLANACRSKIAPYLPAEAKVKPSEYFTVNFVHSLEGNNNPQAVLALLENCWLKLQPALQVLVLE